jgi:hypothetical protein
MIFSSSDFKWVNGRGSLTLGSVSNAVTFPRSVAIKSTKTGKTETFSYDNEVMEANEFFDGEACAYRSNAGIQIQIWL